MISPINYSRSIGADGGIVTGGMATGVVTVVNTAVTIGVTTAVITAVTAADPTAVTAAVTVVTKPLHGGTRSTSDTAVAPLRLGCVCVLRLNPSDQYREEVHLVEE